MSPAFVANMEEVLEVYARPYAPAEPVVCVDEYPLALSRPSRPDLPAAPWQPRRVDYEYERAGSAALFAAFQPLAGWRTVTVTDRRTAVDFALFVRTLVDEHFPEATTVHLVLDNLNTHTKAAFYTAFEPAEARRILSRLAWHFTPAHGSWLNMQEIEWSVLAHQCLGQRRLGDLDTVQRAVDAWAAARNAAAATVRWRFTTPDARRALRKLYPIPAVGHQLSLPLDMAA